MALFSSRELSDRERRMIAARMQRNNQQKSPIRSRAHACLPAQAVIPGPVLNINPETLKATSITMIVYLRDMRSHDNYALVVQVQRLLLHST